MNEDEERIMRERQIAWEKLMSMQDVMSVLVSQKAVASDARTQFLREERRRPENKKMARVKGLVERRRLSDATAD